MHKLRIYGFTLVELLVTITILAVIASLAAPHLITLFKKYERDSALGQYQSILLHAREYALTHRQLIVVCPTSNNQHCQKHNSTSIISFVDTNQNQKRDVNEHQLASQDIDLHFGEIQFNVGLNRPYIKFFPDTGKPRGYMSNVTYCPNDKNMRHAKSVILSLHGLARFSQDTDNDGLHEKNKRGQHVTCK